jgi:hypothetical protein
MKKPIVQLLACVLLGVLTGCGHSANTAAPTPDPATQPEAQAALFQRTCDRVKGLIANKDYKQAQETLALFKNYKLTAEQQKTVDQLRAQIPKTN